MKVNNLWLREWADTPMTPDLLASKLTMAGFEVEALVNVSGDFNHVIVAQVIDTKPHPEADRLTLCEVDTGKDKIQIVCGAQNVRPNLMVALALPGATLPGGLNIKESKLRGKLSQGMLCSYRELEMEEDSEGIIELPHDAPLGQDLREYLQLDDIIFDVNVTPNRSDCLSVLGLAREVAALNESKIKDIPQIKIKPSIDTIVKIDVKEEQTCPQYYGRVIKDIDQTATTPLWMKERLRRCGMRTIHPVVDILNYVMLELGQPMHAFDLKTISTLIQVRFSEANEHLTLLDGRDITLKDNMLVIADKNGPLCLAGIMGGKESQVHTDTVDIFLESALFDPISIAKTAREYRIVTDSSQRFERGIDSQIPLIALERATALILEIAKGKAGPVCVFDNDKMKSVKKISFNPEKVKKLIGIDIPVEKIEALLKALNMKVDTQSDVLWEIQVPSYRNDITLEVDLIEEVIRLYGYEKLSSQPINVPLKNTQRYLSAYFAHDFSLFLASRGYHEVINYSFVDPELQKMLYGQTGKILKNPISPELSSMRLGLWSGLLASLIYNSNRRRIAIKLFEVGTTFSQDSEQKTDERHAIAGLISGQQGIFNWNVEKKNFDFYDVKGDLEALFAQFKISDITFITGKHYALHPGQTATIMFKNKPIGWLGTLHPKIADSLDLEDEVILFELFVSPLSEKNSVRYKPISKYPSVRRDLSLLINKDLSFSEIEKIIKKSVPVTILRGIDVFDIYQGVGISEDKKSIGIALTLQEDSRTLVEAEINIIISAIIEELNQKYQITLRD